MMKPTLDTNLESERNTYVVCKTGRCARPYSIEQVHAVMRYQEAQGDGLAVSCPVCNGVLVEADGTGSLSTQHVRLPFITAEELEAQNKRRKREIEEQLQETRETTDELERELAELNAE